MSLMISASLATSFSLKAMAGVVSVCPVKKDRDELLMKGYAIDMRPHERYGTLPSAGELKPLFGFMSEVGNRVKIKLVFAFFFVYLQWKKFVWRCGSG